MHQLRLARSGEEQIILQMVQDVLAGFGLATDPEGTDKDLSDLTKYYLENKGWFAVLEWDGRIVGSCGIYRISNRQCELRKMYLLPDFQGRGLGKMMLLEALRRARELGYSEIILETNRKLEAAIRLYRNQGFTEVQQLHLPARCDIAMIRELD